MGARCGPLRSEALHMADACKCTFMITALGSVPVPASELSAIGVFVFRPTGAHVPLLLASIGTMAHSVWHFVGDGCFHLQHLGCDSVFDAPQAIGMRRKIDSTCWNAVVWVIDWYSCTQLQHPGP